MRYRGLVVVVVAACLSSSIGQAAGPQLEDVPAPRQADALPAPARWPLLRHETQLRACVISSLEKLNATWRTMYPTWALIRMLRTVTRSVSEEERHFLADASGYYDPLLAFCATFRSTPRPDILRTRQPGRSAMVG